MLSRVRGIRGEFVAIPFTDPSGGAQTRFSQARRAQEIRPLKLRHAMEMEVGVSNEIIRGRECHQVHLTSASRQKARQSPIGLIHTACLAEVGGHE